MPLALVDGDAVYMSIHMPTTHMSIHMPMHMPLRMSIHLSMHMPIHMPMHMSQYTGALPALKDGNAIKVDGAHKLVLRFEESRVLDI